AKHCIAGTDVLGHQTEQQPIGAVAARKSVPRATKLSKLALELSDFLPHDEVCMLAHPQDCIIDPRTQAAALRLEVYERNDFRHAFPRRGKTVMHSRSPAECRRWPDDSDGPFGGKQDPHPNVHRCGSPTRYDGQELLPSTQRK